MPRLTGGAGTGKKIIKNWDIFSFELIEKDVKLNNKEFRFDVTFDKQCGTMFIIEEIKSDEIIISQYSILDMDFDRPLGFYNDTVGFKDGLYEVARRMLMTIDSNDER